MGEFVSASLQGRPLSRALPSKTEMACVLGEHYFSFLHILIPRSLHKMSLILSKWRCWLSRTIQASNTIPFTRSFMALLTSKRSNIYSPIWYDDMYTCSISMFRAEPSTPRQFHFAILSLHDIECAGSESRRPIVFGVSQCNDEAFLSGSSLTWFCAGHTKKWVVRSAPCAI